MRTTTLFALLAPALVGTARADTNPDVPRQQAMRAVKLLKPGAILLRYCPGCNGAFSVARVRSTRVIPSLDDPARHQVQVTRDVLLAGRSLSRNRLVIGAKPRCGGRLADWCPPHERGCPSKDEIVDLAYSFIRGPQGAWISLSERILGEAPSKLVLGSADLRQIDRCATMVSGQPRFTIDKRERVVALAKLVLGKGHVEVRQIVGFKRPPARGALVTVVPFRDGLRAIHLRVASASIAKDLCTDRPYAKVRLEPIHDPGFISAAAASRYKDIGSAVVLHPARKRAALVPRNAIRRRALPRGITVDLIEAAIDLTGSGAPDLLHVYVGEGTVTFYRTATGWKRVLVIEPC